MKECDTEPLRHLSQDCFFFFRWNFETDHDMAVYIIINE